MTLKDDLVAEEQERLSRLETRDPYNAVVNQVPQIRRKNKQTPEDGTCRNG